MILGAAASEMHGLSPSSGYVRAVVLSEKRV